MLAQPRRSSRRRRSIDRDVRRVLLEGGPTLAAAFLAAGCVDEVVVHLAPKLLGAAPCVGDLGISTIADALSLSIVDVVDPLGGDVQDRRPDPAHWADQPHGGS